MSASPLYRGLLLDEIIAVAPDKSDSIERVEIRLRGGTSYRIYEPWSTFYPAFREAMEAWIEDCREHEIRVAQASQPVINYYSTGT